MSEYVRGDDLRHAVTRDLEWLLTPKTASVHYEVVNGLGKLSQCRTHLSDVRQVKVYYLEHPHSGALLKLGFRCLALAFVPASNQHLAVTASERELTCGILADSRIRSGDERDGCADLFCGHENCSFENCRA